MSAGPDAAAGLARALDAGRYAAYVWPSYAATALGFLWMIADSLFSAHRWRRRVEQLERARAEEQD